MREIKFKYWLYDVGLMLDDYEIIDPTKTINEYIKDIYRVGSVLLLQYTGLKDKNGVEIYEGDIIHAEGYFPGVGWYDTGEHDYDFIDQVEWDDSELAFVSSGYYLAELEDVKVMGNIYENFELLSKQEETFIDVNGHGE